jgi:hypothetical protein
LAAPQKHGHQADPGKDKKKTRRAEPAGLSPRPRCRLSPQPPRMSGQPLPVALSDRSAQEWNS